MLPERYTVENIKRALQEPSRLVSEFQRIYTSSVLRLNSIYFKRRHGSGLDVTQKDWDNLILLDACRYDLFKTCIEEVDIEGDLQPVISAGSQSWEFMNNTFENETFHDTVYVTANPHVDLLSNETFFKTYPLLEEWNDDAETVFPEDVANAAYDAHNENPNKKLIVHFMQPHLPFLGSTAQEMREKFNIRGYNNREFRGSEELEGSRWYEHVKSGNISIETTQKAYHESLLLTLRHVEELISRLNGKTVISSDHGEHLGERLLPFTKQQFGHPGWEENIYTQELRVVPWFTISHQDRRNITVENPEEHTQLQKDEVQKRLDALGYT